MRNTELPTADVVVGISSRGIVPATMTAHELRVPIVPLGLNFRDKSIRPWRPLPHLYQPFNVPSKVIHILLAPDVMEQALAADETRHIGFTVHADPAANCYLVEQADIFHAVLCPANVVGIS